LYGITGRVVDKCHKCTENHLLWFCFLGSVRAAMTKEPSDELEKFLCYAKCILTETRGRRVWTTLVLYIISLCALCTAGSFDKARLLLVREVPDLWLPQRQRATSIRPLISRPCDSFQGATESFSRHSSTVSHKKARSICVSNFRQHHHRRIHWRRG